MLEKLNKDMVLALKNKEKEKVTVIRGVKATLKKKEIDEKCEISDDVVIDVLSHEIKSLKDSMKEFEKGERSDLVEKARFEIQVLQSYLPDALTDIEVMQIIDDAFLELKPLGMNDMGRVMKFLKSQVNGRYDMSEVSRIVKERLGDL